MRSVLVSISLLFLFKNVSSKRILAVELLGTKSHVLTYLPLLEELSKRGHEVTLLSPLDGFAKEGVREIVTVDMNVFAEDFNLTLYEMIDQNIELDPFKLLREVIPRYCSKLYDRADIQSVMEESFDLVIFQPLFNDCALGLIHKVQQRKKAPLILVTPNSAPNLIVGFTGGHHPPSFVPNIYTGFRDEMTFPERMKNFGAEVVHNFVFSYLYIPTMEALYREKLGSDLPSAKEILGTTSIILSNGHFSVCPPKPNLPDVIDVGGIHSRPAKPLPKDFEDFIQKGGEDGFLLFSFGTGARGDQMPAYKKQLFVSVFGKLKQRVIWKYEAESIENLPENVMLRKWVPQQDLLGHPKIKMFITHCGFGGIEESMFHGVPLLGIPLFGDQPLNAQEAENHGFLFKLEWKKLTAKSLMNGINKVLNDPIYKRKAQEISATFKDQIDSPLERAVWWTEYVLRHNGASKLQSPARKLNFVQYHSLDVVAAYISILGLVLYVSSKIVRFFFSLVLKCITKDKTSKKKRS